MGIGLGSEGQGGAWVLLGQQECKGPSPVPHSLHSHSGFGQENSNTVDFTAAGPWLLGKYSTTFYSNNGTRLFLLFLFQPRFIVN